MKLTEAYTKMREYFSRPDARIAVADSGLCLYRTEMGDKCAFGALIPDKLYDHSFEGTGVYRLLRTDTPSPKKERLRQFFFSGLSTEKERENLLGFLIQAQQKHDSHRHDLKDGAQAFLNDLDEVYSHYV